MEWGHLQGVTGKWENSARRTTESLVLDERKSYSSTFGAGFIK